MAPLDFNQMPILNIIGKTCCIERGYIIVTTQSSKLLVLYSEFMFLVFIFFIDLYFIYICLGLDE